MNRPLRLALELLVLALGIWQIADVGIAMASRIGANLDIEWMEGATLITGKRFAEGLPFYARPTADYIPFIYPPVYAWVLGALSHVFPLGYTLGRSISIVGTIAATTALVVGARQEGMRWPIALGIGALFVSCYEESGTFYDLVRIDMLAMLSTSAALVVGRREGSRSAVASGLLLALGFATKHNMAAFGLPILLWRWRFLGRADAARFAVASIVPAVLFIIGMQVATGGLFLTYLLEVPATHGMVWTRAVPNLKAGRVEGAQAELFRALPLVTLVGLGSIATWIRSKSGVYWGSHLLLGLVLVSMMRGHQGGYVNVLIPMFWLMPLLFTLAWAGLEGDTGWRRHAPLVLTGVLAAQLWEGRGNLDRFVPTAADRKAAAALVEELRALPGPIAMPHAPWYPVLAGKEPSFALIALWDIDHEHGPFYRGSHAVDRALADGHWATLVLPDDKLGHGLNTTYKKTRALRSRAFRTRTGWGVRFGSIWEPVAPEQRQTPASDDPGAPGDDGGADGGGDASTSE